MQVKTISTKPFDDQNPGTSGLRKRVQVFQKPHYAENYIQAIFQAIGPIKGKVLVLGGDGRYYNREVTQIILKMAIAQRLKKIMVGQHGILSTPATSHIIRKYQAFGGIILSASHNLGGRDGDFGVKYNIANGGPAPEKVTQAIFAESQKINAYQIADIADIDIDTQGTKIYGDTQIEIIDSVRDYADLMEEIFDFNVLRAFCATGFKFRFDGMNAVTGPYAYEIFENRLGLPKGTVMRATPLPDFGGDHPDPNPTNADALYQDVMSKDGPDFGAASDGDGDRNMIVGRGMFVGPSDSLAILAANATLIKHYQNGIAGVARSMPTSMAVDAVAKQQGIEAYETPTGWKFFGNLLDSGKATLCGEESFGTGSNHIREKDGIWAILMWFNILAVTKKSIKQLVEEHWAQFGRNYYSRHDYEGIELESANTMIEEIRGKLATLKGQQFEGLKIVKADDFAYHDPIDHSVSKHQGIRIFVAKQNSPDDAVSGRIIFRLSGTGTVGATLRLYLEHYEKDRVQQNCDVQQILQPLIKLAEKVSHLKERFNRLKPNSIV